MNEQFLRVVALLIISAGVYTVVMKKYVKHEPYSTDAPHGDEGA